MTDNKPLEEELNDTLGAIFDKVQEESSVESLEHPEEHVESAPVEKEAKQPKAKKAKEPVKAEEQAETQEAPETQPEAQEVAAEAKENTDQKAEATPAPAHWSGQAKPLWDSLPPLARAEYLKQEGVINKLRSQQSEERKRYDQIESVIGPRRQILMAEYGGEAKALEQLFALSDFAAKDPVGFIQYYAQRRGVNLRGLAQNTPAPQQVDPTITALQQQVQNLNQQLTGFTKQQEQSVHSEIDRTFQEFASNPANKYLEDVREDMAFFIETGKASDWQTAYNMAVKINPVVSELVQAERHAEAEAKKKAQAEEAANKAKKAQQMNVSTRGVSVSQSGKKGDWTDTLNEAANRAFGA